MSRYVSIMSRDRLAREGGKKKNREKVRFGFVLCDVDLNKIQTLFVWINSHASYGRRKILIGMEYPAWNESYVSVYKEKIAEHPTWERAIEYIHHNPDPTKFSMRVLSHLVTEDKLKERLEEFILSVMVGDGYARGPHKFDTANINNWLVQRIEKICIGPGPERGMDLELILPF